VVSITKDGQEVHLRIADNGLGLPPDAESKSDCYGLRGMRERVEAMEGSMKVAGGDSGTQIEVALPWEQQQVKSA